MGVHEFVHRLTGSGMESRGVEGVEGEGVWEVRSSSSRLGVNWEGPMLK